MKRMEKRIAITFAILCIAAIIINGIHSVVAMNAGFFTSQVMERGLKMALTYLLFVWVYSSRHPALGGIGVCATCIALLLRMKSTNGTIDLPEDMGFGFCMVTVIYVVAVAMGLARIHSEMLRREDRLEDAKKMMNIEVDVFEKNKPEDIESEDIEPEYIEPEDIEFEDIEFEDIEFEDVDVFKTE